MPAELLDSSYRFCQDVARREAKNFYYSFLLLPRDRRRAMCGLYAYMRRTDDLADEPGEASAKARTLDRWSAAVEEAIAGRSMAPEWPELPALADTVARYGIPPQHLREVIDGVRLDLTPRSVATFDELYRYCYLVASAVGLCCIRIWGYRSDSGEAERRAESCGIALQLTNILRDVREDAQNGRVYLPAEDLDRFGVSRADLMRDTPVEPLRRLLAFEAERAGAYYREARPLVGLVEPLGRPVLRTITGIYGRLLDEIVRRDFDVMSDRVRLPGWRKAAIAARALVG
jgi:phytoene synthase